ncbi:haloalkane dehalogenase [Glaciecola sp. 1036]|uniref:haloalkane dehalogenase n=1 Tax=Alteromonadaceae TaxID=72275 RepID=UPI003D04D4B2
MAILKTPEERFQQLPGYSFQPHYCQVDTINDVPLHMHYVDFGDANAPVVLLIHGEPTWSYSFRNIITQIADIGLRVIAPDLIGFGKSDKLTDPQDYSLNSHFIWLKALLKSLNLQNIMLFCQDTGGLLGMRLVADDINNFNTVIAVNTMLPIAELPINSTTESSQEEKFNIASQIQQGCKNLLIDEILQGYDAPFPNQDFVVGPKAMKNMLFNGNNAIELTINNNAWNVLKSFNKPFITVFSDEDLMSIGIHDHIKEHIPGCKNQQHYSFFNTGHFIQEDAPEKLIAIVIRAFASLQLEQQS